MAWLTRLLIRALRKVQGRRNRVASHIALGRVGESEAYFYLKQLGYEW
jgi:hypothetical protein